MPGSQGTRYTAVSSYSLGTSAAPGAKPAFQDLTVKRAVDAVSPYLQEHVATQASLSGGVAITVSGSATAPTAKPTTKITLGGETVSSDRFSGTALPTETVTFHYTSLRLDYFRKNAGGTFTDVSTCWDLNTGSKTCPSAIS
ncbi:type VI secretion system tube protein Hcp [Actinacidiphila oryziradicis]|uniref:type VI secretion system tube protein Hcp n=1 Tax=Actinacidiphila oryziradicis TaxID=2571141 RepID=UPI0023F344AE|nr:type VI secretion system tube protein Hcp [Actinacidiphila oryziradicis]MCW2872967.1 Type secretion system effector, Hcp [Actinacidiphila oryziradicis]